MNLVWCGKRDSTFFCFPIETHSAENMSDPFAYKEIGNPTVAGSKWGQTSGTSTDVIYPVSQLFDETFKEGSTVSFNLRSDRFRHWSARNTRMMVEYEAMYGECNEMCADPATGPVDGNTARPPRSLRMTSMPNAYTRTSAAAAATAKTGTRRLSLFSRVTVQLTS